MDYNMDLDWQKVPTQKTIGNHETCTKLQYFHFCFCFLFLMLFVICRLWILDCIFHNLDNTWCWSTCFLCNFLDIFLLGEVRMGNIRKELLKWEVKFRDQNLRRIFLRCVYNVFSICLCRWCVVLNNRYVSSSCEGRMPQHCKNQSGRECCISAVP